MYKPLLGRRGFLLSAAGAMSAMTLGRARADQLTTPTRKVFVSISGKIGVTNGDGVAQFDMEMLEGLRSRDLRPQRPGTMIKR